MRLITRGDFDGLVCAVLLNEVERISEIVLVHPKEAQDQLVSASPNDIVANLPYIRGCGMWFDHHASQKASLPDQVSFSGPMQGAFELAPSCAEVIRNYYERRSERAGKATKKSRISFRAFRDMITAAGRLDSADLKIDDILRPQGWILLGMTLDPRSGLGGGFEEYFRWLAANIKKIPLKQLLKHPKVVRRTHQMIDDLMEFKAMLSQYSRQDGPIVVTDFRGMNVKPAGNRFQVYAMFPHSNVALRIFDGRKSSVVVAVGRSITNPTCFANIGRLMRRYGGGGHTGAGAAQFSAESAEAGIAEIIDWLKNYDKRTLMLEWCRENPSKHMTLSIYCDRKKSGQGVELDFGLRVRSGTKLATFNLDTERVSAELPRHYGQLRAGVDATLAECIRIAKRQGLQECAEQAAIYAKFLKKNEIKCELRTRSK